jgi:predicted phosphodiesterase
VEVCDSQIVYPSRLTVYHFYFVGDIHWGSRQCDEAEVYKTLKQIESDPFARVCLMGDLCEYISTTDWRHEPELIADWVNQNDTARCEEEYAVEKLTPIKHKIIGAIQGNHEHTIERDGNLQTHNHLCQALGITNLGYSALVHITFIRRNHKILKGGTFRGLTIYLHHGFGNSRTMGADANLFSTMMRDYEADWFVSGHTHKRYAVPSIQYVLNRENRLDVRHRMYGRSGTFLRGVDEGKTASYAERAGMPVLGTGALLIEYSPFFNEAIAKV